MSPCNRVLAQSLTHLEDKIVFGVQGETHISRQLGRLGMLGPGKEDLALVPAQLVVAAIVDVALAHLVRGPAPGEDHVVGPVADGQRPELDDPQLGRGLEVVDL